MFIPTRLLPQTQNLIDQPPHLHRSRCCGTTFGRAPYFASSDLLQCGSQYFRAAFDSLPSFLHPSFMQKNLFLDVVPITLVVLPPVIIVLVVVVMSCCRC